MTGSDARRRTAVQVGRRRIEAGERPLYHATWSASLDGAADVSVSELPLVHVFAPDHTRVSDAARLLVSRTLAVGPETFDLVLVEPSAPGG
jgi:hypothetical protein